MSSSSDKNSTMIRLKSSDGELFEVEESIAFQMNTIKAMIDDDCASGIFPLPNVSSQVLAKVIEYCRKHAAGDEEAELAEGIEKAELAGGGGEEEEPKAAKRAADPLKDWDSDFLKVPSSDLFDIVLAANYLGHNGLMDLTCQAMADVIKYMLPEQVRSTFNIENDFTPEEEQEIRNANKWAFENVFFR